MTSSVSSVSLVPVNALSQRSVALRPVDAGVQLAPAPDLDALRRAQAFQTAALRDAPGERARNPRDDAAETAREEAQPSGRRTPLGNSAPFVAQLLAQDQPPSRRRDPFAEASRAYGRFREVPRTGFILDPPDRVDVTV